MKKNCSICTWIKELASSPFLVKELKTGYVVLSKYKFNKGYVLFLYKNHLTELDQLEEKDQQLFLSEMAKVAKAVSIATNADKMNYELLGNTEPHLHWHIIPRYKTEKEFQRPIWVIDKTVRQAEEHNESSEEIKLLKGKILKNLI